MTFHTETCYPLFQVKALYVEKEMLLASNKSLAEYNLSQEPILADTRSELEAKKDRALILIEVIKDLKRDVEAKSGKTEPDTLLALLQVCTRILAR